jgi:hypothetical protein
MNDNSDRGILAAVRKMTGTYDLDQVYLVTGTCSNIDEAAGTCDVDAISGNATTTISAVRFQAAIGDGIDCVPVDGSVVKVLFSKYTTPLIVQYSDIEKVFLAADLVQFNDGALGGLVKVIDLTTKLNNLENKVNSIISIFNAHLHTSGGAGSPTTPPTSSVSGTLSLTSRGDIEDTIITH